MEVLLMFELTPFDRRRNQIRRRDERPMNVDQIFESFFNDAIFPRYYSHSGMMHVDIKETDESFELETDLPGVDKEQINIETDHDRLTITVNQNETNEEKQDHYIRKERRVCSMARTFDLENIDVDQITATMDKGVLRLHLPKQAPDRKSTRLNSSH